MGYNEKMGHPIDEDTAEKGVYEFTRCGDGIEHVNDLNDLLLKVQEAALKRLSDYHREASQGSERIDAWGETRYASPKRYIFLGPLDGIWDHLFEETKIDDFSIKQTLLNTHRLQAEKYGVDVSEYALLVVKPMAWEYGQSAFRTDLMWLLRKGLTPAEAVDLLFTEYEPHTINQSFQADRRNISQQAVSKNVKQAKAKLRDHQTRHLTHLDEHGNE